MLLGLYKSMVIFKRKWGEMYMVHFIQKYNKSGHFKRWHTERDLSQLHRACMDDLSK